MQKAVVDCDTPPPDVMIECDFAAVEARYQKVYDELEGNIAMEEFLNEFVFLHDAMKIATQNIKSLENENHKLKLNIQSGEANIERSKTIARNAQITMKEMKEAMENAFRRIDAAHVREQQTQEALTEAERQISRLRQNTEQNNRGAAVDSDNSLPRSQDEQRQDRERLMRELNEMRTKLANATTAYDEVEKKNMAAGAKIDTMAQHLEVLSGELSKEVRLREALEAEHHTHAEIEAARDETIASLTEQLSIAQRQMSRLENSDHDIKTTYEKLSGELEVVSSRAQRAQQDYELQLVRIERLTRENAQKGAALKVREEEINRVRQEAARSFKAHELHIKRLALSESARADVERERDELKALLVERERESERLRKQAEALKKRLDELNREKDLQAKNLMKTAAVAERETQKLKQLEQVERTLRTQIELSETELSQQKAKVKKFERECDKLRTDNARKAAHNETVCEQLRNKHGETVRSRREVIKENFQRKHEIALLESVRTEKEAAERQIAVFKAQAERLQDKIRDVEHKSSQLKASLTAHESQSMKNELALQRAERERESARHELRQARDQLSALRHKVNEAELEQEKFKIQIQEFSNERQKLDADVEKIRAGRKEERKETERKCEEINELKLKIKNLEIEAQRSALQYDQRVDDVKLLKLEIENLRQEKAALSVNLNDMANTRQQLFRLQRDLTSEQLKCRALEEEVLRPLNIHRWRYLQGEDPDRFELLQQLALAKRRISQSAGATGQSSQPKEERPFKQHVSPEFLFQIRSKCKQIKALQAECVMHKSEVASLRNQVHQLGGQLQETKQTVLSQKKQLHHERSKRLKIKEAAAAAVLGLQGQGADARAECKIVVHQADGNKTRSTGPSLTS